MRGRKPIGESAKSEMLTIRLTKKEREVLDKNDWLKKEIVEELRNKIKNFIVDNDKKD